MKTSDRVSRACVEYFSGKAGQWSELYKRKATFRDRIALFTGAVDRGVERGGQVLDFGCGSGDIAAALARDGYRVVGVDPAPGMIAEAVRRYNDRPGDGPEFVVGDEDLLAEWSHRFDAVVCSSVLEYVDDDAHLLSRLAAVLRPGGLLLFSVPHAGSLTGTLEDALTHFSAYIRMDGRGHLKHSRRRYDEDRIARLMARAGVQRMQCVHFEVPRLGRVGVKLSRLRAFGVMTLIGARKAPLPAESLAADSRTTALSRKNLWEKLSPGVRRWVGAVARLLPESLVFGKVFCRQREWLDDAQWWSSSRIRAYQADRIEELIDHARRLGYPDLRKFDDLDDLRRWPCMTADDVRQRLHKVAADPRRTRQADCVATGGTSGRPLSFLIDASRSHLEYAYLLASWRRAGYQRGMPMAVLRGRVVRPDRSGLYHEYDPMLRHHYYSSFHMNDETLGRYLEHIAGIGPCFLHVYPSTVLALGRFIRRTGVAAPGNVRGIIAESEIVYPQQRRMVEEVFGCRLFSCYGQSEKVVLACGCEHSDDYHVWPTYGYFELLDEQGRPVTEPGERGEIVGTGFINTVMPFIRYRTGDWATYVGDRCDACGRQHPVIRDIRGHRVQETLVARDGTEISWTAINMHDDTFDRVRQFQFYQDTPGKAVLRAVVADRFDEQDRRRILENLARKLDGQIDLVFESVDAIQLTDRGKTIYVDQAIEGRSPVGREA